MNRDELITLHASICGKARKMMEGKNQDYAAGTTDPFANFRATEVLGIKAEIGILMRCMDKFARIQSFVKSGTLAVKSESVRDAIEDTINYMVLLAGVIQDREDSRPKDVYPNATNNIAQIAEALKKDVPVETPYWQLESMHKECLKDLKDIKDVVQKYLNKSIRDQNLSDAHGALSDIKNVLQRV